MIFWWIVRIALWALAGYVAARLMNTSLSLIWNIVLGLVGGAVGSLAAGLIGIGSTNMPVSYTHLARTLSINWQGAGGILQCGWLTGAFRPPYNEEKKEREAPPCALPCP